MSSNEESWYRDGLRFGCTQCGNCCSQRPGYVWVNEAEREAIAAELGMTVEAFVEQHTFRVGFRYSLNELGPKKQYDCVFLVREGDKTKCGIYTVRPKQCRTWPFWNENLPNERAWNHAAELCPGMNKGKKYDFVQIELRRKGVE
ncbi:MAG: hypothetical protein HJJLKODD_00830 [Phycisphaerae bacterium]|nr:hypothetical protein [Phycisphaerae bacterium]